MVESASLLFLQVNGRVGQNGTSLVGNFAVTWPSVESANGALRCGGDVELLLLPGCAR